MRKIRLKQGIGTSRQVLRESGRLMRVAPSATVSLGIILALLPALLRAFFLIRSQGSLLQLWEAWFDAFPGQSNLLDSFILMVNTTLVQSGRPGLWVTLLDLAKSLFFSPLLLSSLALLYNGFIFTGKQAALSAVRTSFKNVRHLVLVALACMLAEWFAQMVPSLASGVLSLVAQLVSWIPVLGTVVSVLAAILSLLISLLTSLAVTVIFCYVWICAVCEGVSGFGALVRSWQLTRNAMRETIYTLLSLMALRGIAVLVFGLLWAFAGRALGIPLSVYVYIVYAIGAVYLVQIGAATSALYQRRPQHTGPAPGQFRTSRPDPDRMKRANIN